MLSFFSSLSLFGWILIALAVATIWQFRSIMEMIFYRSREGRWPIPGEDPPHHRGSGQSGRSQNDDQGDDGAGD